VVDDVQTDHQSDVHLPSNRSRRSSAGIRWKKGWWAPCWCTALCRHTAGSRLFRAEKSATTKCINITKTRKLVFHRSHPTKFHMPCTLDGIVQQHVAKLLAVFFSDKLSFEEHVNFVLTVCSQRIYLLKLLRSQGLPPKQQRTVFTALSLWYWHCHALLCSLSLGWPSHRSAKAAN